MTPRGAGWLAGVLVFTSIAGSGTAVTIVQNAADTDDPTYGPLAVRATDEDPVAYALELIAVAVTTGTVFALAATVIAWWIARKAVGRDGAERLLALKTASLHGSSDHWGTAMRAELASIDEPGQRTRFARSAAALAFRRGTGKWPAVLAVPTGVGAGVLVFAAARASFDRRRDGILAEPLLGLVLLLLVAAVIVGTLIGRSFRAGLEAAMLAWLAVYLCSLAVEIPLAYAWYRDAGVLLLDGEGAASHQIDALGAALEPITHFAYIFIAVAQLAIAVLAAAFATMVLRLAHRRPTRVQSG